MLQPNPVLRRIARTSLKDHWLTALLIALIVNLPTLLLEGISTFTGNDTGSVLLGALESATAGGILDPLLIREQLGQLLKNSSFWLLRAGDLIAWLITPALMLGMNVWMLNRLRGQDGEVSVVFCRLNIAHKAIGLRILIGLKLLLWMLPGMAVSCLSLLPLLNSSATTLEELYPQLSLSSALVNAGCIGMLVPAFMAYLRYILADIILSDCPDSGIRQALSESKTRTSGLKGQLFGLLVFFIACNLGASLLGSLLGTMFGSVASLTVQLLLSLVISVYMQMSFCAVRENLRVHSSEPSGDSEHSEDPDNLN